MLTISETHMEAFGGDAILSFLRRVDAWLAETLPQWRARDRQTRANELRQIAEHGRACGMEAENEMALFAWVCCTLGPDWRARITEPAIWGVLSDAAFNPQVKLMHIEQKYPLGGERQ